MEENKNNISESISNFTKDSMEASQQCMAVVGDLGRLFVDLKTYNVIDAFSALPALEKDVTSFMKEAGEVLDDVKNIKDVITKSEDIKKIGEQATSLGESLKGIVNPDDGKPWYQDLAESFVKFGQLAEQVVEFAYKAMPGRGQEEQTKAEVIKNEPTKTKDDVLKEAAKAGNNIKTSEAPTNTRHRSNLRNLILP